MKAIRIDKTGGPEVLHLADVAMPWLVQVLKGD
jgi:NADPH:quinone reductase-like Zn-dependent oxidoreductase